MAAGADIQGSPTDVAASGNSAQNTGTQIYHRVETPTQTAATARKQALSGEVWGRPARGSGIPSVKAYFGPLVPGQRGIEFTTPVPHDPNYSYPFEARWYYGHTPGVQLNNYGFAFIPAVVTNKQVP
ncbi:hypothetical protein [Siccirubricoccus sp. G192]|uniref:hypothetical protein n=1 Tax=Siccirubricoccus sp. G192 TaxID=2849651 RepID=UPI001C2C967F|nr:hypothetical protein [Siccirubricoccus sp. G192]MBV1797148.1 hypothetical protein [Siccirubricoccus sp. G192]